MTNRTDIQEQLRFNGIRGDTGEYSLPPMSIGEFVGLATGLSVPENLDELKYRYQTDYATALGVKEHADPRNLGEAGWGIIFAHDEDSAVKEALSELLDIRESQAGEYFRIYEGADGYRPDESKVKFLARHGAGPGPADPDKVPYFLLIVGGPDKIPFRFQSHLDIQYAVGRIHFDTLDGYANYAKSVVASESGQISLPRQATFFGVGNPDDQLTSLSLERLVTPLYRSFASELGKRNVRALFAEEANKGQLVEVLGGGKTPAVLFSASHGMTFPSGDTRQLAHQGALLCQDWPGPNNWSGSIPHDWYFAGEDLSSDANLLGLIAFFYASYGGGTPLMDDFAKQSFQTIEPIASHAFLAQLPVKMLSHARGGALAVIAQFERAWGYSFPWPGSDAEIAVFESTLRRLFDGYPVGSAMEYINERYAELSTVLSSELEEFDFGKQIDPYQLGRLWTANRDARNFTLIGDPAIRLPIAEIQHDVVDTRELLLLAPLKSAVGQIEISLRPDINSPDGPTPHFIWLMNSHDEQERAKGIEEARKVVQKATEVYELIVQETKTLEDLDPKDRKVLQEQKALKNEISRLVDVIKRGQDKDRQKALVILEALGPAAKTEALPALKDGVRSDPDDEFRPKIVKAITLIENDRPALISELRRLLQLKTDPLVQEAAIEAITELKPPASETLQDLWALASDENVGPEALKAIFYISEDKTKLLVELLDSKQQGSLFDDQTDGLLGSLFLTEEYALDQAWGESKENKILILDLILATFSGGNRQDWQRAINWLTDREKGIPGESLDSTIDVLRKLTWASEDSDLQSVVYTLIDELTDRKNTERKLLEADLRSKDRDKQINAIKRAAEIDDEWALRVLVREWVQWIASGQSNKTELIEQAAEKMRHNELSILPLVNQLTQEFQPSEELIEVATSASEVLSSESGSQMDTDSDENDVDRLRARINSLLKEELDTREWNIHQRIVKELTERKKISLDEEAIRKEIVTLIETEFRERELRVHQRIARQLADMSNPNYYELGIKDPKYQEIKGSLGKYAVPVLARLLPEAADDEIRKNLAYTLGNVGGNEAVDALARAVVGEERTRANRQKLLAEYYLDPSRQRSDEASEILQDAVKEAKRTLWFQQGLNVIVFIFGLLILVGGLVIASRSKDAATLVGGILVGLGGFAGIIAQLVKNPLDRIQNAMANLVQLETAFTSFIWELNLNGTYIQSQYVAEGKLSDDDIAQTVGRIEEAMNLTMDQVAVYTEKGRHVPIPHITSLSPMIGDHGNMITIFGQHLKRNTRDDRNVSQQISIAVNHVPVVAKDLSKDSNIVKFELPANLPPSLNTENRTIWLSLIINGRETNCLPFHLTKTSANGETNAAS